LESLVPGDLDDLSSFRFDALPQVEFRREPLYGLFGIGRSEVELIHLRFVLLQRGLDSVVAPFLGFG